MAGEGTFAGEVIVEPAGPGRYRGHLGHGWDLFPIPQGGIVASFALRAAAAELGDPGQPLRTATAVFAGQVTPGALQVDVQILRRGRSASQVVATVHNEGTDVGTTVMGVFGGRRTGPSFVDVAPPPVPPPADCPSYREPRPAGVEDPPAPPFWARVEGRAAIGHPPWEEFEPSSSDVATWLRYDDPPVVDGALDPLAVLALADRMPGAVSERVGHRGPRWFAPSADLTVHFFAPARTTWLLAHDRARWAGHGWASAESTLWDEDGGLVAYATQMMVFTYLSLPANPSADPGPPRPRR